MNIFDIVIIILLVLGGIIGFKRGVIKEVIGLVCFILAFIIAYLLKDFVAGIIINNISGLNSVTSIIAYKLVTFLVLFILVLILSRIILKLGNIVDKLVKATVILEIPSKILGFIVGVIKYYLVIFVALLVVSVFSIYNEQFNESHLAPKILDNTPFLSGVTSKIRHTINDIKNIDENVKKEEDVVKALIDNKLITKKDLENLTKNNKIKNVEIKIKKD
ncbi:MAG: CvpA family protein [Bacilli bacterium]|nr:CvpA family protein [Bacilli bacterium]